MDFTGFHGGILIVRRLDIPCHISRKGMPCFVGDDLYIALGTVEVCKNERRFIGCKGSAVPAARFSFFCLKRQAVLPYKEKQ